MGELEADPATDETDQQEPLHRRHGLGREVVPEATVMAAPTLTQAAQAEVSDLRFTVGGVI